MSLSCLFISLKDCAMDTEPIHTGLGGRTGFRPFNLSVDPVKGELPVWFFCLYPEVVLMFEFSEFGTD